MPTPPSITLLHLSDIQIGRHHRFDGDTGLGSLLDRIGRDLDKLRDTEGLRPDLVLLTGDLSEWGLKSELDQVARLAMGLADLLSLPARRVVMLPGNHDINRKLCEAYFAACMGEERQPVPPYSPKYKPFAEMFARFYEGDGDIRFTDGEPWSLFEYPDLRVVVAALNSTVADSHRDEDHYGFVGERQIRWFAEKLRSYRERGWLRIGTIHHDILAPESEAAKQDKKDLEHMLAPYLNILVHGHTHIEQVAWLDASTPVPVLGIGSAGVKVPERPAEVPNQYQILQLFADRLVYGRRAYVPDRKDYIGCLRSDPAGNAWRLEKKVVFDRVEATFSAAQAKDGSADAPRTDLAQVVEAYRAYWTKAEGRVWLFDAAGLAEDADIAGGLDLLHIFVPQKVRRDPPSRDVPHRRPGDFEDGEIPGASRTEDEQRSRLAEERRRALALDDPPQPVEDLLVSPTDAWVTILGAPGAGKTALTRWLGLRLCAPGEAARDSLRDMVPVRVELRRFDNAYRAAKEAGRSYDFFDHLDEAHRERSLRLRGELLKELASQGRLLWLFDGLDEVPELHARREYAQMIAGLRMRYAGRGVVTSRIVGARPVLPVLEGASIRTHTLLDFEEAQILAFVEKWHTLAFPGALEVGAKRKERLVRAIRGSAPVRELCKNPLLLTLISLLNRGAELPHRRHLIYERAVDLLAEQWEANKHLAAAGVDRFDLPAKKKLLRELAWKMMVELHGGSGNWVREEDLLAIISAFCQREMNEGAERAKHLAGEILRELRERNGILALLGGRAFGFLHKTFLEYLAAAEVIARFHSHVWDLEHIKELFRKHWNDQAWEETLTLVCGMLQDDRPAHVVESVQAFLSEISPFDVWYSGSLAFAVRCLVEVRTLDQEPIRGMALLVTRAVVSAARRGCLISGEVAVVLRTAGDEWPGKELSLEAVQQGSELDAWEARCLSAFAGATVRPAARMEVLRKLPPFRANPYLWIGFVDSQIRRRPWNDAQVDELLALIRGDKADIGTLVSEAVLLRDLGNAGVGQALERLVDLLLASSDDNLLQYVSLALLHHPRHRGVAAREILQLIRHGDARSLDYASFLKTIEGEPELRSEARTAILSSKPANEGAIWELACLWRDEEALRTSWEGLFTGRSKGVSLLDLEELSSTWPLARTALDDILARADAISSDEIRIEAANLLIAHGRPEGARLLESLVKGAKSSWIALNAARYLATQTTDVDWVVQRMVQILRSYSANARFWPIHYLATLAEDLPAARSALEQLVQDSDEAARLQLATGIANAYPGSEVLFRRLLVQLAGSAKDHQIRLEAAAHLRAMNDPPAVWREAFEYLSRHAKTGRIRLEAAKALHDEKRIKALSLKAKRAKVRADAALALEALRIHREILEIGRKRKGLVSLDGLLAGHIEELDRGTRFTYDSAYLKRPDAIAIAPTLPLRREPYDSSGLHPFFENLLPEGWLLDLTCRKVGIDRSDSFGLLLATCADCAGAVEILPDKKAA